ncbi:MAG: hypothetical protein WBA43_24395, partial [Elainellaceae cyanobacterium]
IVDLVATGRTLQENHLIEIEPLFTSTARLIAHPLSYRIDLDGVRSVIDQIRHCTAAIAPN